MDAITKQHKWLTLLNLFNKQNKSRPTRIGVFEGKPGEMMDYWIEDKLPLAGIDVDERGENAPTIEIMLSDSKNTDSLHMTHTVFKASVIKIILTANDEADGLEIEDAEGKTTVLRFEE